MLNAIGNSQIIRAMPAVALVTEFGRLQAKEIARLGLSIIRAETAALESLGSFVDACRCLLGCHRRIVVGMGKSGHIARKIAATLASPAFYMHPAEACHDDPGTIQPRDVVVALSSSGETDELLTILPMLKRLGVPMLCLTGNPESTPASAADINLDVSVPAEACPLGLAPTSSTTATLGMGKSFPIPSIPRGQFRRQHWPLTRPATTGRQSCVTARP